MFGQAPGEQLQIVQLGSPNGARVIEDGALPIRAILVIWSYYTEVDMSDMYRWAEDMWRYPRSITGRGVRETISYLQVLVPGLEHHSVPSGTKAFDWRVPNEWNIRTAHISRRDGSIPIDWEDNNLHVLGYSWPIRTTMSREELEPHLYSLPKQPDAIPYMTSYYKARWGFCLSHNQRSSLGEGPFRVLIDSDLRPGVLDYADLIIPGASDEEVLLSSYICHPMMANDSLSGVVVTAALARWLMSEPRRYTYRIVFIPETIGSIVYLSQHLEEMKRKTIAGFVLTCLGDSGDWTFMPSPAGNTLADRVAGYTLGDKPFGLLNYLTNRGSDERQYCSPGANLPVCSVMRTPYGLYPEYHTSLDNLDFISQEALDESLTKYKMMIKIIEANRSWERTSPCEPFMTGHDLSSGLSTADCRPDLFLNICAYADGTRDLIDLANSVRSNALSVDSVARSLQSHGILK